MNLLDTLENPSFLHAATVHFPIVLFVLCIPASLLALIFNTKPQQHLGALVMFLALVASCLVAEKTGEDAYKAVPSEFDQAVWDQINEHEQMAETLKFIAIAGAILAAIGLIPNPTTRQLGALGGLGLAVGGTFVSALTAHYGGELVYRHGVGTEPAKQRLLEASKNAPPAASTEDPLLEVQPIDLAAASQVSFARDIWPIVEARCLSCHEGEEADGGYDMSSVESMKLAGEKSGAGIIPGDPDNSSVVKYIRGELRPRMPKNKKPMPIEELHLVRQWIAAGAVDDSLAQETAAPPSAAEVVAPIPAVSEEAPLSEPVETLPTLPGPAAPSPEPLAVPEPEAAAPPAPEVIVPSEPEPMVEVTPEPAPVESTATVELSGSSEPFNPFVPSAPAEEVVEMTPAEPTPTVEDEFEPDSSAAETPS